MFSCEFCEISKNNFCYRTHPVAASVPFCIFSNNSQKIQVSTQDSVSYSIWHRGFCENSYGFQLLTVFAKSFILTDLFPSYSFSTPWKQKTVRFSDVFRGWRKGALGTNKLKMFARVLNTPVFKNRTNSDMRIEL